jgi:hypothetical protein
VKPLLVLFYLAALSITLSFVFPLNDLRLWLHPQAGPRYFLFACVFIVFAIQHLAFAARSCRGVGRVLLAALVAVGIPADFFHPGGPDTRWADQCAVFRSLPAGSDFWIPVVPLYHQGMVLHKKALPRDQPPLARLQPVQSRTPAFFNVTRPQKVGLNEEANSTFLSVAGWATDGTGSKPAGGVFVMIDDKVFPAVYGLPANIGPGGESCPDCGFSRLIPFTGIGPGVHTVSIVVLTRDRKGSYQPTPPRTFTTSQFLP